MVARRDDWGTVRTFWKGEGGFEAAVERNQVLINFEIDEWLHDWLPPLPRGHCPASPSSSSILEGPAKDAGLCSDTESSRNLLSGDDS